VPVAEKATEVQLDVKGEVRDEQGRVVGRIRETIKVPSGGAETLAGRQVFYQSGLTLPPGRFVAKVVLRENTGVLYLNGTQVAQNTKLTLDPLNLGNTVHNWLGRSQYAVDPGMDGSLEAVQISCRAYSAAEIAALAAP